MVPSFPMPQRQAIRRNIPEQPQRHKPLGPIHDDRKRRLSNGQPLNTRRINAAHPLKEVGGANGSPAFARYQQQRQ